MISGKKIIGVCVTKMQYGPRTRVISHIQHEAEKSGYKLIVFNSAYDFGDGVNDIIGAAETYRFINYDIIDALIILCSGFLDKSVYRAIADKAVSRGIPVVLEDDEYDGCFTVKNAYEDALFELMDSVIKKRGIKETFFLAGVKGNPYSEQRIDVYKRVLAANGIPFEEDKLGYGDFWEVPARKTIEDLLTSGRIIPQAVFCANDAMAIAASRLLIEKGFRVPKEVVVTGFDGSMMSEFYRPSIPTCVIDYKQFAGLCMDVIRTCFDGAKPERVSINQYAVRTAESGSQKNDEETYFREMAESYHRLSTDMLGHEHVIYNELLMMLNSASPDMNSFYGAVSKVIGENSSLAISPSFLTAAVYDNNVNVNEKEELVIVNSDTTVSYRREQQKRMTYADMIPDREKWAERSKSIYVINAVLIGKTICGYYEARTNNLWFDAQRICRELNLINVIIHTAVTDARQRFMRLSKKGDNLYDSLTDLPNLHSLSMWFEKYTTSPWAKSRKLAVSVYQMTKYRNIYEAYGLHAVETMAVFVAEALKLVNRRQCFIARSSENEFVVVNYFDRDDSVSQNIDNATRAFYSIMDSYNRDNGLPYFVEVFSGCTEVNDIEGIRLETVIRKATDEIYNNKIRYGAVPIVKENIKSSKEEYAVFNALIANNLFVYHFQPIVSAVSGDIVAYEALMRTDERVGFGPLEVLGIASDYQRLYDVEKATLFNVMRIYEEKQESFMGRMMFINSIPGHFLNDEDSRILGERYRKYIKNFVFEITEQDSTSDEELNKIRHMGNGEGSNIIAVDDYGAGHSNMVNLLKYSPEVIKLDSYLIADIHRDSNKQLLVKGIVDFAKVNGIKVLAEGIGNEQELEEIIRLGVDYIQGFYTGIPSPEPAKEINPEIRSKIRTFART